MILQKKADPHVYMFVDGAASQKQDIGAYATLLTAANNEERQLLMGTQSPTTISRMELVPIIEGFRWLRSNWAKRNKMIVRVYSDSEYTVKTLCGLYLRQKNTDLWAALDDAVANFEPQFIWRARNTLPQTEVVDSICSNLRRANKHLLNQYFGDYLNPVGVVPPMPLPTDGEVKANDDEIE
jgi:ribonuclease HI